MANKFKNNKTGTETNSIFKGNWAIDTTASDIGGGPSSVTDLYNGAAIPTGGYTMYSPEGVYVATTDSDLLLKVKDLGGDYSSISAALTWASLEPSVVILNKAFDNLVTDGLVLTLDASNISSFTDSEPTVNYLADGLSGYNIVQHNRFSGVTPLLVGTSEFNTPIRSYNSVSAYAYTYSHDWVLDDDLATLSGQTVTFSIYMRSKYGPMTGRIRIYDNQTSYTYQQIALTTNFQRFEMTKTIGINPTRMFVMIDNYGGDSVKEFHSPQLEIGSSATPFVDGTRSQNTSLYDLSGNNFDFTTDASGFTYNTEGWFDMDDGGITHIGAITGNTACTVVFWMRTTDAQALFLSGPGESQNYLGAFRVGNKFYNSGFGSPTFYTNTVQRANIYDFIRTGEWMMVEFKNVNMVQNGNIHFNQYGGYTFGNGDMATMMIYDRNLTTSESQQNYYKGPIVTSGLVLALDAGNLVSYENGAATTYNLAGSETGTLTNGVGFDSNNSGTWTFDGTDDNINTDFTIPAGNRSMDLWIKYDTLSSSGGGGYSLTGVQQSGGRYLYTGITSNGGGYSYAGNTGGSYNYTFSTNEWYYVATVMDSGTTRHYVNGEQVATKTYASSVASTTPVMIGAINSQHEVAGSIPITRIYNKALTAEEVQQNFSAQRNRFGI